MEDSCIAWPSQPSFSSLQTPGLQKPCPPSWISPVDFAVITVNTSLVQSWKHSPFFFFISTAAQAHLQSAQTFVCLAQTTAPPSLLKCQHRMMKAYSGTVLWDGSRDSEQSRRRQTHFQGAAAVRDSRSDSSLFYTGISCQSSQQPERRTLFDWTIEK